MRLNRRDRAKHRQKYTAPTINQISKINPDELAISVPTKVISCMDIKDTMEVFLTREITCPAKGGLIKQQ
ncbi:hypothetical protein BCT44_00070 [Vibrio breoganii]|nr:hypothetical protein BCT44_00070 [Vibrio breoganii]